MDRYLDILLPILFDSVMLLAAVAAVMGLLVGLWLLLHPDSFARFEAVASRSISLRRSLRPLEISRNIDRHIYRHHKAFGLLVVIGSAYTIYSTLFNLMPSRLEDLIALQFPVAVASWILSALNTILIAGNLFAIVIGMIIFIRPSTLKSFEAKANTWVSTREHTRWMDTRIDLPDQLAQTKPRLIGIIFVVLSTYLMSLLSIG